MKKLTVPEAAAWLGVKEVTVRYYIPTKRLRAEHVVPPGRGGVNLITRRTSGGSYAGRPLLLPQGSLDRHYRSRGHVRAFGSKG